MYKGIPKNSLFWWHHIRRDGTLTHITVSNCERTQYSLFAISGDTATLVTKIKTPAKFNDIVAKDWGDK
jgi:hypothetical protein